VKLIPDSGYVTSIDITYYVKIIKQYEYLHIDRQSTVHPAVSDPSSGLELEYTFVISRDLLTSSSLCIYT
jgi:hypothetical protein